MNPSKLNHLIKEVLASNIESESIIKKINAPILKENLSPKFVISEHLKYHIDNKLPILNNTFRYGSKSFIDLWHEVRMLYESNKLELFGDDKQIITETSLGSYGIYEGQVVPLDLPLLEEDEIINEAEKKKQPPLNKPHRGGSKKFYVYVRKPGGGIKKVSFGQVGMSAKINNPKARQAFAKRHKCSQKTDKTKASYWSCRLPRYASLLGLKSNFSGYW